MSTASPVTGNPAAIAFADLFATLTRRFGEQSLVFPKEIMWLSGAPGAGKGLTTSLVREIRGIQASPIEVSALLNTAECKSIKAQGALVSDAMVSQAVLEELIKPEYSSGAVVDGFPRTAVQGEIIKLLYDKMMELREKHRGDSRFRRPIFQIMVLFIDEETSIQRQLKRGVKVRAHNKVVRDSGVGTILEERATDSDAELARERYHQFKEQMYESLQQVKDKFHFHFIDANGTVEEVRERIKHELEYQSKMELAEDTFDCIRRFPLAKEIIKNARQNLVRRLDGYQRDHPEKFNNVVGILLQDFSGILTRQALSGEAVIRSDHPIFEEPLSLDMALDVLTERGYGVVVDVQKTLIPSSFDPETKTIVVDEKRVSVFKITFNRASVRRI